MYSMQSLSDELVSTIFSFLSPNALGKAAQTSQAMHVCCEEEFLWMTLLKTDFPQLRTLRNFKVTYKQMFLRDKQEKARQKKDRQKAAKTERAWQDGVCERCGESSFHGGMCMNNDRGGTCDDYLCAFCLEDCSCYDEDW
jgi:hypothetical protein